MTARVFTSLAEVTGALGEPLGPSDWLVVDQRRIDAFAETTGDDQWIHIDPERAATGPFGRTVAHGYLTLSLIPYFGRRLFHLGLGRARVNYGVDRARFPAPVLEGSRLRASATFAGLRETQAGAVLTTSYTIELDGARKPACVAETITLILGA